MTRNFRALGLALAALFAVSAVSAQAAFGAEEFHAHAKHIVITGEQHPQFPNQTIVLNNEAGEKKVEVVCKKLKLEGDVEGTETAGTPPTWTSTEATVHPEYDECKAEAPLNEAATVETGRCHYRFASSTEMTTGATGQTHARVKVTCPKVENIKISTVAGCVIKLSNPENPPKSGEFGQTPTHGVVYTNVNTTTETNKKEITAHTTAKGIEYTSAGFACALAGIPASGNKAELNGTATLRAFEYISGSTEFGYKVGNQVGLWKE